MDGRSLDLENSRGVSVVQERCILQRRILSGEVVRYQKLRPVADEGSTGDRREWCEKNVT